MSEASETRPAVPRQHVIHLLRTVQQNQLQLIVMADQKANILIGGALILLTILATQLNGPGLNPVLLVLVITAGLAAVFAILAAKPRILPPPAIDSRRFNPLFFGHFKELPQDDYIERIEEIIADEDRAYRTMARDIYQAGQVLQNKYRYLAYSYRTFLAGLALTAAAFVLQYLIPLF